MDKMPACLLINDEKGRAMCTRNDTSCPRAASVSGEMPERAASSGENPRGRGKERGEGKVRQRPTSQEWRASWTDDCGANSAKRTTTRSQLAPSTSNLALFKNEDGAGLKLDKCLIGWNHNILFRRATAPNWKSYNTTWCFIISYENFPRNPSTWRINKIRSCGGRGVREFVAWVYRLVRGYVARFK